MHQIRVGDAHELALRQMPVYVLHHEHGGVNDQAEINGAHRQQVRRFAAQYHEPDGESKCERYGGADYQGGTQIAEKCPLHHENQGNPDEHVMQHRMSRDVDQLAAIVDLLDLHPRWQDA